MSSLIVFVTHEPRILAEERQTEREFHIALPYQPDLPVVDPKRRIVSALAELYAEIDAGIPNPAVTAYCDKVFPSKVW